MWDQFATAHSFQQPWKTVVMYTSLISLSCMGEVLLKPYLEYLCFKIRANHYEFQWMLILENMPAWVAL